MQPPKEVVRIAALGDIHFRAPAKESLHPLWSHVAEHADVLLLCGDVLDTGTMEEAQSFSKALTAAVDIPIIGVLGNHEYESGRPGEVRKWLEDGGITLLDGEAVELFGIGFAGVKGFVGGFGKHALQPWGEASLKSLVHETLEESLKLESALAKLRTSVRIALMHYAPIRATVEGEPPEIFPFLGSSKLEDPLNRFGVAAAFHGHAHRGQIEGITSGGVPVYNVALPLLQRQRPDVPPVRVVAFSPNPDQAPPPTNTGM